MIIRSVYEYLQQLNSVAVVVRLILATFCGSLVGWERVARRHSAGIRTFSLVSLGSAVAATVNLYLSNMPNVNADAARIPAQVVSGIGFLGAGMIIVTGRNQIKGLTTAASLWVVACMGMAFGSGYISAGILCFVLIMASNILLMHLSQQVEENSRYVSIYIEVSEDGGVKQLRKKLSEMRYRISSMNKTKDKTLSTDDVALLIDLDYGNRHSHKELLEELNNLEFVNYVEEV